MKRITITEEMNIQDEWYKEARDMTPKRLKKFIKKLTKKYNHDYGTICHAITSGAIATAWAIDRSSQGGITGFQAGCIMWSFIRHWNYSNNKCGLRIVDYDNMLYPQYDYKFDKTISKDTWKAIQEQAKENLKEVYGFTTEAVVKHWQSIVDGVIPFGYRLSED